MEGSTLITVAYTTRTFSELAHVFINNRAQFRRRRSNRIPGRIWVPLAIWDLCTEIYENNPDTKTGKGKLTAFCVHEFLLFTVG